MLLYAFNAFDFSTGKEVGLLVNYDSTIYHSLSDQLLAEHPTKYGFRHVVFLPIWTAELYAVWQPWQCLHTEGRFDLGPFTFPVQRLNFGVVHTLDVQKLRAQYDPFRLTRWLWGCDTFSPIDVLADSYTVSGVHSCHGSLHWTKHAARVRELMDDTDYEPIQVCTDYHLRGAEIMVEEGNHRFAACIVRGDKVVRATCVGDMYTIRKYEA